MHASRRTFLGWMAIAVTAVAAASWWRRSSLVPWLVSGGLAPDPPGSLRDSTADILRASTVALLSGAVVPEPYVGEFRWRAEHVPGARALYERFEAAVDRAAREGGDAGFRSAPRDAQRRILSAMLPARGMARVRRIVIDRDEARFARHIVREIFQRFARTDAWVLAGYDAWPGVPRAISHLTPRDRRS